MLIVPEASYVIIKCHDVDVHVGGHIEGSCGTQFVTTKYRAIHLFSLAWFRVRKLS